MNLGLRAAEQVNLTDTRSIPAQIVQQSIGLLGEKFIILPESALLFLKLFPQLVKLLLIFHFNESFIFSSHCYGADVI